MYLTNSHICKLVCLIHLHRTSIYICYSNIQPSVLSVALATDQRSSNCCYNCTRQTGSFQPAVKINLQHADTLLRGCFYVDTLHSISIFCCKFYPSIQLTFSAYDSKQFCTLIKHSVTKLSVILPVQYTLSYITSFFEEIFYQSRNFYENNMILWYYQIRPEVVWKVNDAWIDGYNLRSKTKTLPLPK